jgi:hypothetical protein
MSGHGFHLQHHLLVLIIHLSTTACLLLYSCLSAVFILLSQLTPQFFNCFSIFTASSWIQQHHSSAAAIVTMRKLFYCCMAVGSRMNRLTA